MMARWTILLAFIGAFSAFYVYPESLGQFLVWQDNAVTTSHANTDSANNGSKWDVLQHQGGNSPWFPKVFGLAGNASTDVPPGCRIDQVHMISRHTERYPTELSGRKMLDLYDRIRTSNITLQGDLAFANDAEFFAEDPSRQFEQLVSTGPHAGTLQAFTTGVKLRTTYKALLDHAVTQHRVSVWASDSQRVIDTAKYFSMGFFGLEWDSLAKLVIIPETNDRGGDTLTPGKACLGYLNEEHSHSRSQGAQMLAEWRSVYLPPIMQRLAKQNPAMLFTETEVYSMQELCGFESIAKGSSPWCDVFTQQEWEAFEYARDLLHYYRIGGGNLFAPAMGLLWLNATANLLRQGSSDGTLFFSFVHDGDIIPLLTTLRLFPETTALPTTHIPSNRTWRLSDVLPMGGRLIFERIVYSMPQQCWDNGPLYPNHVYCATPDEEVFVRLIINDGVVALPECASGPGASCPLDEFLQMVTQRGLQHPQFSDLCNNDEDAPRVITFLFQ